MGHHVDRVDLRHPPMFVLGLRLDLLHHRIGDLVAAADQASITLLYFSPG
jgi:hypothetical protein